MRHSLGVLLSERSADRETREKALVHRHSAPNLVRDSLSAGLVTKVQPENILMQTYVGVTDVSKRDDHCVYSLEVDTGFGVHVVHRRYSEIRDFRIELLQALAKKTHCGHGTCVQLVQLSQIKFPSRRPSLPGFQGTSKLQLAQSRVHLLERFLEAILRIYRLTSRRQMRVCNNSRCAVLGMIQRFLNVAASVPSASEPVAVEMNLEFKTPVVCPVLGDDSLAVLYTITED
jgi:hypothetical protein